MKNIHIPDQKKSQNENFAMPKDRNNNIAMLIPISEKLKR